MTATHTEPDTKPETDIEAEVEKTEPETDTEKKKSYAAPDRPASRALRRVSATTWLTAAVIVLVIAVAALATLWRHSATEADDLRQTQALSSSARVAATAYATDLTTYDHSKLDVQQQALAGESTKKFQSTFEKSMKTLGPIFEQVQATATGKVTDAAVVKVSEKKATVLAFVDQQASSTQMAKPETQSSRVRLNLVRHGDRWLLDAVDLV